MNFERAGVKVTIIFVVLFLALPMCFISVYSLIQVSTARYDHTESVKCYDARYNVIEGQVCKVKVYCGIFGSLDPDYECNSHSKKYKEVQHG